jgi:Zn-dependent protease with chaperone function
VVGLAAYTLALAAAPFIVAAAEEGFAQWLVALTLMALLIFWHVRYVRVLLWLWRAEPVDSGMPGELGSVSPSSLTGAFAAILAKATVAPTRVWQAGARGAVVANAVALAGISESHVVFSRTVFERLSGDEVVAVFAHEVAHLEYHNRSRMIRRRLIAIATVMVGTLLVPVSSASAPSLLWAMVLWPAVLVIQALARARRVHGHELASDRRALDLCGNPEALVSALTKLHTIARLPRRWSAQASKHPSLAQRVRAIRSAAGFRAPVIEQIELFASPAGGAFLLLDRATLQYASGVSSDTALQDADMLLARAQHVRRIPYTDLKACRIVAPWNRPAMLHVTERNGRRLQLQVRDADLPRLHDLLDIIEFGMPTEAPAPFFGERQIALGVLAVALMIGPIWSVALLALLAFVKPAAETLIGAAVALSFAGLLQWIDPSVSTFGAFPAWVLIALGGGAVDVVLWRLWSGRARQAKAPAWCIIVVLSAAAIVWLQGLLQWDGSLLRLVQEARVTPAAMLLPLAAAVMVARAPVPGRRAFAAGLALAAVVPAAITTGWFQDAVVADQLLGPASPLPVVTGEADRVVAVAGDRGSELRLSPEGDAIATAETDDETERIVDFTIRTPDGKARDVHAADLQFLDDARALLLVDDANGLALRLVSFLEETQTEWSLTLPALHWSRLSLSPQTGRWRVIGHDGHGQVARLQGSIGQADYEDVRWTIDEGGMALGGAGNAMLVSRTDWRASLLGRLLPELAMATSPRSSFDVSVWRVRAGSPTLMTRSSADVECVEAPVDLEPVVCFAFDGIATRLWALSAADRRVMPIGVLAGYAHPLTRGSDGTLVVWWRQHPVLLQLDPLRARELSTIPIRRWARAALASHHLLIADNNATSTLAIYRVETELTRSVQP